MAQRYMGEAAGTAYVETYRNAAFELLRLEPGTLRAWDFADEV